MQNIGEVTRLSVDILSIILSTIGIGGIVYGFNSAGEDPEGFMSIKIISVILISLISFLLFLLRQLKLDGPLLDVRLSNKVPIVGDIKPFTAKIFSSLGVEVYSVSLSGKEKEVFKEVIPVESHFSRLSKMNYRINTLPLTEKTEKKVFKQRLKLKSNQMIK